MNLHSVRADRHLHVLRTETGGDTPAEPTNSQASPPVSVRLNATMLELQADALKAKGHVAFQADDGRAAAHLMVAAHWAAEAARVLRNIEEGSHA